MEKYKYLLHNIKIVFGIIVLSFILCFIYGMFKQKYHPSKMYEFDGYATNVDRYRGYGKETFNKLGFNPLDDNEAYYNANTTGWQDFGRMTGQFGALFASSFMSNYHAVYNYFSGHVGLMDAETEAAEKYNEALKLGLSTRGGIWEIITNNFIYSAFPYGNFVFWFIILTITLLIFRPISPTNRVIVIIILFFLFCLYISLN